MYSEKGIALQVIIDSDVFIAFVWQVVDIFHISNALALRCIHYKYFDKYNYMYNESLGMYSYNNIYNKYSQCLHFFNSTRIKYIIRHE